MEDRQQLAIDEVKSGRNVFVTGSGGVGKTYVSNACKTPTTVVVAPTGVAALNAGGMTCHKAFGLPVGVVTDDERYKMSSKVHELFCRDSAVTRISFDEIGMLRRDYLEVIDFKLRKIRNSGEPFGGLQVTAFGDFFQLEPIVSQKDYRVYYDQYSSPYGFTSDSWIFDTVELHKVYRQEDERQVKILNSIRKGDKYAKLAIQRINEETKPYENSPDTLHLCCYRSDAKLINDTWYSRIKAKEMTYYSHITGSDFWNDSPVDHEVSLKVGAKVIIKANDIDGEYVNGDRGTVKYLHYDYVEVELLNGRSVFVRRNAWEKYEYVTYQGQVSKEVTSTFSQIPIALAYALTVHSVQGLTLEDAALHTGRGMFSKGQLYVALSRIKDIRNLSLVNEIEYSDLKVSREVQDFYRSLV